jgi:photosystem II stability/assembly factor-like uncharacterized protein
VVVPSSGGNFDFGVGIANVGAGGTAFETWSILEYPDGSLVGPLHGPHDFLLPSRWNSGSELSQTLLGEAPAGRYTMHVRLGQFPGLVWASSSFELEKAAATPAWYRQPSGTNHFLFEVFFTDPQTGWASGMLETILHTDDGGDNWYPQPIPPSSHYYDLHFVDSSTGWAVGSNGKIAHTADGGASWTFQPSGRSGTFYGVYFVSETTGWVAGGIEAGFSPASRYILRTTDGGETWQAQLGQLHKNPLKDVFFADANHGWAVGEPAEILRTVDGGATWTEQDAPLGSGQLRSVFFLDPQIGWAVGRDGTALHTTNGGVVWQHSDIDTAAELTNVFFADAQNGWAVGGLANEGVVFRTSDGGESWHSQEVTDAGALTGVFFTDAGSGWAVGYDGTIIHTDTGGE